MTRVRKIATTHQTLHHMYIIIHVHVLTTDLEYIFDENQLMERQREKERKRAFD